MKIFRDDFRKMQTSIVLAMAMTTLATASAFFSYELSRSAISARANILSQRDESVGKLQRVRTEEADIKEKSLQFQQLETQGIIGEEQRLEWIELLKEIRDKRRLIGLHYEIEPQRLLEAPPGSTFRFYASTMKVQLKLLHEEDLTRFLSDIRSQAKALVQIKSCNLSRLTSEHISASSTQANLNADCRIDWITLREGER